LRKRGLSRRSSRAWAGVLAVVAGGLIAQPSMATPSAPASRYASIVLEAETGAVLYERNADLPRHPASLTKIMTLYLAFEALESKKLKLTDEITMSAFAVSRDPSRLNLAPGSRIKVEQAIRAMTTKSANDVACAIAEHLGQGSEQRFAEMMTARAKKLGLTKTVFYNASGLPHDAQVSSARDLALLSKALIQTYPGYYHYFSEGSFEFHGKRYPNQNRFLRTYYGADGIKTGFVNSSGHNLAASSMRGGKRLIAIVLGGDTQGWTREHTSRLLDTSYAKIDPSLSMVASNAGAAPGSPTAVSLPQVAVAAVQSAAATVSVATPAATYAEPSAPVAAYAVTVPAADPIPTPSGTANLLAYATAASSPKLRASAVAARAEAPKKTPTVEQAPAEASPPAQSAKAPAPQVVASVAAPAASKPAAAVKPAPVAAAPAAPASAAAPAPVATPPAPKPVAIVEAPEPESARPASASGPAEAPLATRPAPAAPPAPQASRPASVPAASPAPAANPAPAEASSQPSPETVPAETVTTNNGGGDWSVQVGLFRDATVARRRGEEARNRMPLQLRGADLVVGRAVDGVHVTSRISRLSEADARAACTELQRGQVPCVVVPPGRPMVVATN
jgi:D-alanyl-D-alanine carboxypeptidase